MQKNRSFETKLLKHYFHFFPKFESNKFERSAELFNGIVETAINGTTEGFATLINGQFSEDKNQPTWEMIFFSNKNAM